MHTFREKVRGVFVVGHYQFIDGNSIWVENIGEIKGAENAMLLVNYLNGGPSSVLVSTRSTFPDYNVENP